MTSATLRTLVLFLFSAILVGNTATAQSPYSGERSPKIQDAAAEDTLSAFRKMISLESFPIEVPTPIEVELKGTGVIQSQVVILENETGRNVGSHFFEIYDKRPAEVIATGRTNDTSLDPLYWSRIVDGSNASYVHLALPEDEEGNVIIELSTVNPIVSSGLSFDFAQNVQFPNTIEVRAVQADGMKEVVLSRSNLEERTVRYPSTEAARWEVELSYTQPLRINEIKLVEDEVEATIFRGVRFIAQPERSYKVYFDSDRRVTINAGESGNLQFDDDTMIRVEATTTIENPLYRAADIDQDGITDIKDNCISVPNTDQIDVNQNGVGDMCDDFDRDGRINSQDNCPNIPNTRQSDEDGDGIGDECDDDESRLTEKYAWLVWVGMGAAGLILVILFIIIARKPTVREDLVSLEEDDLSEGAGSRDEKGHNP